MPQSYGHMNEAFLSFLASSLEIALYEKSPQGYGMGIELNGTVAPGYTRKPITLSPILNMCASNTAAVVWSATGLWPGAYYFGLCLAAGGDLVYWGAFPAGGFLTGRAGASPTLQAGSLLIDWTNPAAGMAANWGPATGMEPLAEPGAINIIRHMAMLTDGLPSEEIAYPVNGHLSIPMDYGSALFLNMMADQTLGSYLFFNVIDATRGSTAGYTVTGPNSLAF